MRTTFKMPASHWPVTVEVLKSRFLTVEELLPEITKGSERGPEHEFINFAFDFFRQGYEPSLDLIEHVLEMWLVQQYFEVCFGPRDLAVLSRAVKVWDLVPNVTDFVIAMEEFKTEFARSGPVAKQKFLQFYRELIMELKLDANGQSA